jgi:hypothetical protein
MRLKYLTLNKIVDTAYFCGIDGTPVHVLIAAPPGAGKTWCVSALEDTDFVRYINKVYSPNEHRKILCRDAPRVCLLINDDLGLTARWNQSEYFATFCMVAGGDLEYTVYKQTQHAITNYSVIICCTSDYYYSNADNMRAMGLMDRFVPIILGLSKETRELYREYQRSSSLKNSKPAPRTPTIPDTREEKLDLILEKKVDARLTLNLRRMSQYLTEDETDELIEVAHSNARFEL